MGKKKIVLLLKSFNGGHYGQGYAKIGRDLTRECGMIILQIHPNIENTNEDFI